eukprot:CAMPEP_0117032622 /NCGR_PEP_ID=MMETSP0472-20121206/23374_1 /TAXON_ID=693140 ORGANISM="Tiarina fusus, Strain LIS" /NCGR_SAMPLE_ID=MMETSP0472 /ASSEMBLY_ACC=CAM_ASM_000603 /LENGTH=152 /DNA_ID=CAMNT_0004741319 /DNA_START=15 /DNA_END=470 /DNA_ORIENTATION=-
MNNSVRIVAAGFLACTAVLAVVLLSNQVDPTELEEFIAVPMQLYEWQGRGEKSLQEQIDGNVWDYNYDPAKYQSSGREPDVNVWDKGDKGYDWKGSGAVPQENVWDYEYDPAKYESKGTDPEVNVWDKGDKGYTWGQRGEKSLQEQIDGNVW